MPLGTCYRSAPCHLDHVPNCSEVPGNLLPFMAPWGPLPSSFSPGAPLTAPPRPAPSGPPKVPQHRQVSTFERVVPLAHHVTYTLPTLSFPSLLGTVLE